MKSRIRFIKVTQLITAAILLFIITVYSPAAQGGWSFAVLGDSRGNPEMFTILVEHIKKDPSSPELVVHTGDMVNRGNKKKEWQEYRRIADSLGDIPLYPVCGNHDSFMNKRMKNFIKYAQPPGGKDYYSLKHKNAGFVILNSYAPNNHGRIGDEQLQWLKETLKKLQGETDVIFAFLHKPMVTREDYRHPEPLKNHTEVKKAFKKGGVKVVFAGHEHRYDHQEADGIHHFIAAGAGAHLYGDDEDVFFHYVRVTVTGDHIITEAVDEKGKAIRRVKIPYSN